MEIQYVIINFLILAAILVVAGRKTVKRIFGDRRKKILSELDEADRIENTPLPVFTEEIPCGIEDKIPDTILAERAAAQQKLDAIRSFEERE